MALTWIDEFLPLFRCPDTHQPLRWADPDDLARHARAADEQDGSRFFPIDQGIPILLPQAASSTTAS
jgi:uncharacterized protein YbaR (Trm112 family)